MGVIREVLCLILTIYWIILIARIVLSWIPNLQEPLRPVARVVSALTDPLLTPLRGLLPPIRTGAMALDLSPIILFVAIAILQSLICR